MRWLRQQQRQPQRQQWQRRRRLHRQQQNQMVDQWLADTVGIQVDWALSIWLVH